MVCARGDMRELDPRVLDSILSLLAQKTPKARIARDLGVGRQTVINASNGVLAGQPLARPRSQKPGGRQPDLIRCKCGGLVVMPCRACALAR